MDAYYPRRCGGGDMLKLRQGAASRWCRYGSCDSRGSLSVLPLDSFVPHPAERIQVDNEPETLPQVQLEAQAEVNAASGKPEPFAAIVRQDFYERAKKTYCVIITGETRGLGLLPLQEGPGDDARCPAP